MPSAHFVDPQRKSLFAMLKKFRLKNTLFWAALCLIFMSGNSLAASPLEDIQRDFAPVAGYVILAKDDLYLVDLDASNGLMAGDLLVVKEQAEQVLHPQTGDVIEVRSPNPPVLRVTMVDEGFSRTALATPGKKVEAGMPVVRYQGLKAYLQAPPETGRTALTRLAAALPHLLWQGYQPISAKEDLTGGMDLIFRIQGETLTVIGAGEETLHSYAWSTVQETRAFPEKDRVAQDATETIGHVCAGTREEGPVYIGTIDNAVIMSAFTRHQDKVWTAATDGRTIKVFEVGENLTLVAETELPVMEKGLTLAWWEPVAEEELYLVVDSAIQRKIPNSASTETSITSSVYRFENGALTRKDAVFGMFLNSFDIDQDNRFEVLLAQEFNPENISPPVLRMVWRAGRLTQAPIDRTLPENFRVHGTAFADLDGDRQPEIAQVENGHLTIYKENRQLYRFPKKFGGSLARLTYDRFSNSTDPLYETRFFQLSPQIYPIGQTGKFDLIAVGAEIPTLRTPGFGSGVNKTWLTLVEHDGRRFIKEDLSPEFDHPIQGLWVDDQQVFILATNPGNIFGREGQSELFRLSLH